MWCKLNQKSPGIGMVIGSIKKLCMSRVFTIKNFPSLHNFWQKMIFFYFLGVLFPYMLKWKY